MMKKKRTRGELGLCEPCENWFKGGEASVTFARGLFGRLEDVGLVENVEHVVCVAPVMANGATRSDETARTVTIAWSEAKIRGS